MTLSQRLSWRTALLAVAMTFPGFAGSGRPPIDTNTPEGRLIAKAQAEAEPTRKLQLLELFPELFPNSPWAAHVWEDLQNRYHASGKLDKALAAGRNLLVLEPNNLDSACLNWRIAADMKDQALVNAWIIQTGSIADRVLQAPDPSMSKTTVECGKNAREAVDFEQYKAAVTTKDAAGRIRALEEYSKAHPHSSHADEIEMYEFFAYRELGDSARTLAIAEKIASHNETREDVMLLVASARFKEGRDSARVLHLAQKAVERLNTAEKPEQMSQADWLRYKTQNLTQAYFMIGRISAQNEQWEETNRAYRAALPNLTDPQMRAEALSGLGAANYQLRNVADAIRYYTECTSIPGPLQLAASRTLNSITAEYKPR